MKVYKSIGWLKSKIDDDNESSYWYAPDSNTLQGKAIDWHKNALKRLSIKNPVFKSEINVKIYLNLSMSFPEHNIANEILIANTFTFPTLFLE